jgi:hypothetical protein
MFKVVQYADVQDCTSAAVPLGAVDHDNLGSDHSELNWHRLALRMPGPWRSGTDLTDAPGSNERD